jgi:hypothetical protein
MKYKQVLWMDLVMNKQPDRYNYKVILFNYHISIIE